MAKTKPSNKTKAKNTWCAFVFDGCFSYLSLPFLLLVLVFFPAELYEIFLSRAKERWKSFSETSSENDVEGEISWKLDSLLFTFTNPGSLTCSAAIAALWILVESAPSHSLLKCLLSYNKSVSERLNSIYYINKRCIEILHVLVHFQINVFSFWIPEIPGVSSHENFTWNMKKRNGETKLQYMLLLSSA